ncbi:MAG: radical SAM protein, partial [Candidatus Bathyarchaeota archaeon]
MERSKFRYIFPSLRKIRTVLYSHHCTIVCNDKAEKTKDSRYRGYRKKWDNHPLKKIVAEFPLHVDIEATNACNLHCPMCYGRESRGKSSFIDFGLFKRVIDCGAKYGLPSINLSWRGEPFLHPQLIDMIKYAKENEVVDVRINTNGVLVDAEKCKELLESGLDRI